MSRRTEAPAATAARAALAVGATFFTLLSWRGLSENSSGYLVPLFWICVAVVGFGHLARALGVPALVVAAIQVCAFVAVTTRALAEPYAAFGWLPTTTSVQAVVDRLGESVDAANRWSAPIPVVDAAIFAPLMLLAGTAVVLLVDICIGVLRRAPLAGLPLLAAFTAAVSVLRGVSWTVFFCAALTFVLLLAVDQASQLARWGSGVTPGDQPVVDDQPREVRVGTLWPAASRLGVLGVGLATLAPLAIPATAGVFQSGSGPGGSGGDEVSITNPLVDIRKNLRRGEDVPLIRVSTDDPFPSYLRVTALDDFTGTVWRATPRSLPVEQRAKGPLPEPPGLAPDTVTETQSYLINALDGFSSTWLPTPYPASSVTVDGDWRYDPVTLNILAVGDGVNASGASYVADGLKVPTDARDLVNAPTAPQGVYVPGTDLPDDLPDFIAPLARSVTKGADSQFEQAVRLQDWFRRDGGFEYSLEAGEGSGVDQLTTFLGTGDGSRVGYCEQFASGMAMLARSLGIPARVAVGFLRPDRISETEWEYSAHDLHSWPELYFEGAGWIRFEPTPQGRADAVPAYTTGRIPKPEQIEMPSTTAAPEDTEKLKATREPVAAPTAGTEQGSTRLAPVLAPVAVLLGLALVLVPGAVRRRQRRRRLDAGQPPSARAEGAWAEVRATAIDLGVGWDDQGTLRQAAWRLVENSRALGQTLQPLEVLVLGAERARFSRAGVDDRTAGTTVAAAEQVTAALREAALPRTRRRADWLPASLWHGRRSGGRSADGPTGRGRSGGSTPLAATGSARAGTSADVDLVSV